MIKLGHGDREKWLKHKNPRIGSSDAAAILGCGYASESATTVYARMVHGVKKSFPAGTLERMQQGSILEEGVIDLFAARNKGWKVTKGVKFETITQPEYPDLVSSLDAWAENEGKERLVVEAKVVEWSKDWLDGGVPIKYMIQVLHQMICSGYRQGVVIALVGGRYEERWIEWDQDLVDQMLIAYEKFMECVRNRTPPEDASPIAYAVIADTSEKDVARYVGGELSKAVRETIRLQEQADKIAQQLDRAKKAVQRGAAGCGWLVLDDQAVVRLGKSKIELRKSLPSGVKVKT